MGIIKSRMLSHTEAPERCKHVYRDGHQCDLFVYKLVPLKGYCQGHYARSVRGKDMEKPFKSRGEGIRLAGTIRTRTVIAEELEGEAAPYSLYKKLAEIVTLRFEGYGARNWCPINEYKTIDVGHMSNLTSMNLPVELAETLKEYAKRTNRSPTLVIQDILEEWYADRQSRRR